MKTGLKDSKCLFDVVLSVRFLLSNKQLFHCWCSWFQDGLHKRRIRRGITSIGKPIWIPLRRIVIHCTFYLRDFSFYCIRKQWWSIQNIDVIHWPGDPTLTGQKWQSWSTIISSSTTMVGQEPDLPWYLPLQADGQFFQHSQCITWSQLPDRTADLLVFCQSMPSSCCIWCFLYKVIFVSNNLNYDRVKVGEGNLKDTLEICSIEHRFRHPPKIGNEMVRILHDCPTFNMGWPTNKQQCENPNANKVPRLRLQQYSHYQNDPLKRAGSW